MIVLAPGDDFRLTAKATQRRVTAGPDSPDRRLVSIASPCTAEPAGSGQETRAGEDWRVTSRLRWALVLGALTAATGCGDTFGPDAYAINEKAIRDFEIKPAYRDRVEQVVENLF